MGSQLEESFSTENSNGFHSGDFEQLFRILPRLADVNNIPEFQQLLRLLPALHNLVRNSPDVQPCLDSFRNGVPDEQRLKKVLDNKEVRQFLELLPGLMKLLDNNECQQLLVLLPGLYRMINKKGIPKFLQQMGKTINAMGRIELQKFFPEGQTELFQLLPSLHSLVGHLEETQTLQLTAGLGHILKTIDVQQLQVLIPNITNILSSTDIRQLLPLVTGFHNTLMNRKTPPDHGLSSEERRKLDILRPRVENVYSLPDFKMIAWLRARDLDLDKAERMLRRHVLWKKNNQLTDALKFECRKTYFPFIISGYDFEGIPVIIAPIGRYDLRGLIEAGDILAPMNFALRTGEMLETAGTLLGISQVVMIVDFEEFSYHQITHRTVIQAMIEGMRIFEANFPEILKHAFVINAPKVFHILFALIKPIMHSRTLSKVQIFDGNSSKWQQSLFKIMARDQIPPHWGGTKEGRDAYCSEAWFQPPLAPNFMRQTGQIRDEYGEEWMSVKIEAGEELRFEYPAEEENSVLRWAFKTEGYNIGFSVRKETGKGAEDYETVVDFGMVDSHLSTQQGEVNLKVPGDYVLIFHNYFSKLRSKYVHYNISLTRDGGTRSNSM